VPFDTSLRDFTCSIAQGKELEASYRCVDVTIKQGRQAMYEVQQRMKRDCRSRNADKEGYLHVGDISAAIQTALLLLGI
jgi:hypothetical protein